jgi:hypothetical protein
MSLALLANEKHTMGKRSSLLLFNARGKDKAFCRIDTCGRFHKRFTYVTYSPSERCCVVRCMQAPVQCFQKALAYFPMAVMSEMIFENKKHLSLFN